MTHASLHAESGDGSTGIVLGWWGDGSTGIVLGWWGDGWIYSETSTLIKEHSSNAALYLL